MPAWQWTALARLWQWDGAGAGAYGNGRRETDMRGKLNNGDR
jgi:hypothetical protein